MRRMFGKKKNRDTNTSFRFVAYVSILENIYPRTRPTARKHTEYEEKFVEFNMFTMYSWRRSFIYSAYSSMPIIINSNRSNRSVYVVLYSTVSSRALASSVLFLG